MRRRAVFCMAEQPASRALLCTSITASSVGAALDKLQQANTCGADCIELRLDFYKDFEAKQHLQQLIQACKSPCIVTYRPRWEGCGS